MFSGRRKHLERFWGEISRPVVRKRSALVSNACPWGSPGAACPRMGSRTRGGSSTPPSKRPECQGAPTSYSSGKAADEGEKPLREGASVLWSEGPGEAEAPPQTRCSGGPGRGERSSHRLGGVDFVSVPEEIRRVMLPNPEIAVLLLIPPTP